MLTGKNTPTIYQPVTDKEVQFTCSERALLCNHYFPGDEENDDLDEEEPESDFDELPDIEHIDKSIESVEDDPEVIELAMEEIDDMAWENGDDEDNNDEIRK